MHIKEKLCITITIVVLAALIVFSFIPDDFGIIEINTEKANYEHVTNIGKDNNNATKPTSNFSSSGERVKNGYIPDLTHSINEMPIFEAPAITHSNANNTGIDFSHYSSEIVYASTNNYTETSATNTGEAGGGTISTSSFNNSVASSKLAVQQSFNSIKKIDVSLEQMSVTESSSAEKTADPGGVEDMKMLSLHNTEYCLLFLTLMYLGFIIVKRNINKSLKNSIYGTK